MDGALSRKSISPVGGIGGGGRGTSAESDLMERDDAAGAAVMILAMLSVLMLSALYAVTVWFST